MNAEEISHSDKNSGIIPLIDGGSFMTSSSMEAVNKLPTGLSVMSEGASLKLSDEVPDAMEGVIENRRISTLDSILAALSADERKRRTERLHSTVRDAMSHMEKKLLKWKVLEQRPSTPLKIGFCLLTSDEIRKLSGHKTIGIPVGIAFPVSGTICLLDHLILAPKEVIRRVAIHECLHVFYSSAQKINLPIRKAVEDNYPQELHQEEEWARFWEDRLCGKGDFLAAWEAAIEQGGASWQQLYYEIKKSKEFHASKS